MVPIRKYNSDGIYSYELASKKKGVELKEEYPLITSEQKIVVLENVVSKYNA